MNTNTDSPERQRALNIQLLGRFHVSHGDRSVPEGAWRLRNAEHLVKLIALSSALSLHREQIIDQLWPELDLASASNNLRYALYVARRVLATVTDDEILVRRGEQIALEHPGGVDIDAVRFETLAGNAFRSSDPDDLQRAIDSYGGELLPADRYEDWTVRQREALRSRFLSLLTELARLEAERDNVSAAITALIQATHADPSNEDAHAELMRLYARSGQRQRALRQFTLLQSQLRDELDIDPDPATQRLYQDILTGRVQVLDTSEPEERAPLPALSDFTLQHNLPLPLTSFIGREREIGDLRERVQSNRLISLVGPGGSGKSRLALEVARPLVDRFSDGIWFVELAAINDPELVATSVASILKVTEQPGEPLIETMCKNLADRTLLLVLDNCEHLPQACATLVSGLLGSCPGVTVLTTSRERLKVPGEIVWRVPSLALPDDIEATDIADLYGIDSVRLFCERASLARTDFALTRENATAVAQVCRRLDGIPLAIELAAARIAVLSPGQIGARLDNALVVLTEGDRTSLDRHRTLRATIDWSYELLSAEEQTLLRRLSVFAGGWSIDAAEAICGYDGLQGSQVFPCLAQLVDKSLVAVDEVNRDARYRMLDVMNQYAVECLVAHGEVDDVRARHARYYHELAETADLELAGARQAEWIEFLERELDNFRAALVSAQHADPETGLRIACGLGRFWWLRGYYGEGRGWLSTFLELTEPDLMPAVRSKALTAAFLISYRQGDHVRARMVCEEALELRQATGDRHGIAESLGYLAMAVGELGDIPRSRALLEESLALCRELDDRAGMARALNSLGEIARIEGDAPRAVRLYEHSLKLWREIGDGRYAAVVLHNLAHMTLQVGDTQQAATRFRESLAYSNQIGDQDGVASCLAGLASVSYTAGDYTRAARLFAAANELHGAIGTPEDTADELALRQSLDETRHRLGDKAFRSAWTVGESLTPEEAIADADESPLLAEASPEHPSAALLTPREREIAVLVADGLTNAQIAAELSLSPRTADTHVGRILRKLRFDSRAQIAEWVRRTDIASP